MTQLFRFISAVILFGLFASDAAWCQSQASCPVLATLASSKLPWEKGDEHIVIWFYNQGRKTTRGIQFELFMLDAVRNRYPAAQKYVSTGETEPRKGDVVDYPTDAEKAHFGDGWANIAGVEVRVTRVMFKDDTVWVPQKGQVCKMVFMNDEYQPEMNRRLEAARKKREPQEKKN